MLKLICIVGINAVALRDQLDANKYLYSGHKLKIYYRRPFFMKKEISLSIKYASRKVNLCYKELAVRISLWSVDEETGEVESDFIGYSEAAKLVAKGDTSIRNDSHSSECITKVCKSFLSSISFGQRIELYNAMKKIREVKGEDLSWFEKAAQYMKFSSRRQTLALNFN